MYRVSKYSNNHQLRLSKTFFRQAMKIVLIVFLIMMVLVFHAKVPFTSCHERLSPSLPVFPGAEGFGSRTPAGRGGEIIRVTNLNDSGPGSFRAAAEKSGSRIIVFEVGGGVDLLSEIRISSPYVTIAGQTAPEPGIQLKTYGITIDTHDVLIQHIRVRVSGGERNCFRVRSDSGNSYNIVVDHITANWATDENVSIWGATNGGIVHDVTISNSIIAESQYGLLVGTDMNLPNNQDNISLINNLFANNSQRNPTVSNNSNVFVANNLAYNAEYEFTAIIGSAGPKKLSLVQNHYIGGVSGKGLTVIGQSSDATPSEIYIADCIVTGKNVGPLVSRRVASYLVTSPPIYDQTVSLLSVHKVKGKVLRNAGARPASRDSVEERIVYEVLTETGTVKRSVSDAGGWPADYSAPTRRPFASGPDPTGDGDGDGYTNVEEILHQMAAQVEGKGAR